VDAFLLSLLVPDYQFVKQEKIILDRNMARYNLASRIITIPICLLYVIIRLTLLVLAIVALRRSPAGIYFTTWSANLPSIS